MTDGPHSDLPPPPRPAPIDPSVAIGASAQQPAPSWAPVAPGPGVFPAEYGQVRPAQRMAWWAWLVLGLLIGLLVGVVVGVAFVGESAVVDPAQEVLEDGTEEERDAQRARAMEWAEDLAPRAFATWDYDALIAAADPALAELPGMLQTFEQMNNTLGDLVELGEGEATLVPWALPNESMVRATEVTFESEFELADANLVLVVIEDDGELSLIGWFAQFR